MHVSEVMTKDLITLKPTLGIEVASRQLSKHKIKGAPVIDSDGKMLGILSTDDILAAAFSESKDYLPGHITQLFSSGFANVDADVSNDLTVEDVMTKDVITVATDSTVDQACSLMVEHHIHRLPVKGNNGKLAGMISASDILKSIADGKYVKA